LLLLAGQKILNSHWDRNVSVAIFRENYFKNMMVLTPDFLVPKAVWFQQKNCGLIKPWR
jgi:hypothetical protein